MRIPALMLVIVGSAFVPEQVTSDPKPVVLRAVAPPMDEFLRQIDFEGKVVVRAAVMPSGKVQTAVVVESETTMPRRYWTPPHLVYTTFVRKWEFEPLENPTTVDVTFVYISMRPGTPRDDLGTTFLRPYTVEFRSARYKDVGIR